MTRTLRICLVLLLVLGLPLRAIAQEDDKGFLTRTIQDALSGAGRAVEIDGFAGALSSEASFTRMTIADKDGVWLVLEDAALVWNRSALLRGRLEVERLSAGRLDIARLPVSDAEPLPDAVADPFSLPNLPVSVSLGVFEVTEINLGAPLLGEKAQLSVKASAALTDDAGNVDFVAKRTDGMAGTFNIKADFERADSILSLLLSLTEAEDGIAARLLNLPGKPSVEMRVQGQGPLDDFTSDVVIATDGAERLAGEITLGTQAPRRASNVPDRRIEANIGGDITALLAPRYRAFFGEDVRLQVDALLEGNGAIEVSDFAVTAEVAELAGKVTLNQDSWPTFIAITGRIANPDGTQILLPTGGEGTTVKTVDLRVDYDAAAGEAFDADFDITALAMSGLRIAQTSLALDGTLQGNLGSVGQFLGDMVFAADGLELTDAASAQAIGRQLTGRATLNYIEDQPLRISDLDLSGTDYGLAGQVIINGLEKGFLTRLDARLKAQDLSRFSALAGRELDGATALALQGTVTPLSGEFDLAAKGSTDDLRLGIAQADAVLAGRTNLSMQAQRNAQGTFLRDLVLQNAALLLAGEAQLRADDARVQADFQLDDLSLVVPQYQGAVVVSATATQDATGWRVDAQTEGPYRAALTARGLVTGPDASLDFTADVPDTAPFATPFGQDINGPLKASGNLRQTAQGWRLTTDARGPYNVSVAAQGLVTPRIDMRFDADVPDLNPLVAQLRGRVTASGRVRQEDQGFFIDVATNGPYGASITAEGLATGPDMSLTFAVKLPDVQPVVPGVSGPLAATGVVRQTAQGIALETNATGPYASRVNLSGVVTGPDAAVDFNVALANVGALVDRVNGPLEITGRAARQGDAWRLDTSATGPSGTQARIDGTVGAGGRLDLAVAGSAPLGLSRPFLAPRNLQGTARFDLAINGPAALSSVSGRIVTSDASLSAPNLRFALRGINAEIGLGGNRARVQISGQAVAGGRIDVNGAVTLTGSLPADLAVGLRDVVLIDPRLYRTILTGDMRIAGPLTGGARIAGRINVGETNVNVPSTGLTSIGDVPVITHVGDSRAAAATRAKAGLGGSGAGSDRAAGGGGAGFALDLAINAPNRIFVRGRGLDAELGGGLTLTGSTNRIISAGRFDLLRGRLDILGKRFTLKEGSVQFQGDLVPFIRFVSATDTATGEVRVIVEGPADSPEVTFESTPAAPQDEVLARLLFGRNISEISAFQAVQLASAVATLAGRGGGGIIGNLRDGFGLDDLDVTTTEDGATALRLGKYLSDNVYTNVTASSDGTADVSLNLDISPNLTARGTLASDGDSSIGIFFEKDY